MKRIQQNVVEGPNGEIVKVNWMPDNRVRFDILNCGKCVVSMIFPKSKAATNIEVNYEPEQI
jgi:hypothetical protein